MSDQRMYWRMVGGQVVDWCYDHHEETVRQFDRSDRWERVHVLSEADLAAHDAQVRADERKGIVTALRDQYNSPPTHVLSNAAVNAWRIGMARAHKIARDEA